MNINALIEKVYDVNTQEMDELLGGGALEMLQALEWEGYGTGGGGMALRAELPWGGYTLITDEEGTSIPGKRDVALLGLYDGDDEQLAIFESAEALDWAVTDVRTQEVVGTVKVVKSSDHDATAERVYQAAEAAFPQLGEFLFVRLD